MAIPFTLPTRRPITARSCRCLRSAMARAAKPSRDARWVSMMRDGALVPRCARHRAPRHNGQPVGGALSLPYVLEGGPRVERRRAISARASWRAASARARSSAKARARLRAGAEMLPPFWASPWPASVRPSRVTAMSMESAWPSTFQTGGRREDPEPHHAPIPVHAADNVVHGIPERDLHVDPRGPVAGRDLPRGVGEYLRCLGAVGGGGIVVNRPLGRDDVDRGHLEACGRGAVACDRPWHGRRRRVERTASHDQR